MGLTDDREHIAVLHTTMHRSNQSNDAAEWNAWSPGPFPLIPGSLHYRVAIEQEAVFEDDINRVVDRVLPESQQTRAKRNATRLGVRNLISVPLFVEGQPYGMLDVLGDGLSEAEIPAIRVFGNQIAIAIEKARLLERVQRLAVIDEVTGVYNRRFFYERLTLEASRLMRHKRPLTLVMIDIDDFKTINDLHGHLVGDEVLRYAASLLRSEVRDTDCVARYGGDEFAIIMPETPKEDAIAVSERLLQAVKSQEVTAKDRHLKITISLGVATCSIPRDRMIDNLIERADHALYEAKRGGRARVFQSTVEAYESQGRLVVFSPYPSF